MRHRISYRRIAPLLAILLLLAGVQLNVGCYFTSETQHYHDDFGHKPVTSDALRSLKPGSTRELDVREQLGEPTRVLADGSLLAYSWTDGTETERVFHNLCGRMMNDKAHDDVNDHSFTGGIHHLLLAFDATGVLKAFKVMHGGSVSDRATNINDAVPFGKDD